MITKGIRRVALFAPLWLASLVTGAFAGAEKQVEFFVGTCFHAIDDITRVKSLAATLKWRSLPPDVLNMMKPVEGADYAGWSVQHDGELYLVAVNRGIWGERDQANTCTVIINAPKDEVLGALSKIAKIKKCTRKSSLFRCPRCLRLSR